ncbi:hypothetical protein GCM10022254_02620 [Actinomadura meridiana]|uniref:Uncharacterized protein n=1 Tax=Actinomadura meridiana TaxID=559626 RepID=A0ABP8BRS7_9ACTN
MVPPNAAQPQAKKAAPQTKNATDPQASQAPHPTTTNPAPWAPTTTSHAKDATVKVARCSSKKTMNPRA